MIPAPPMSGTSLASLETVMTWHTEILNSERDHRAAEVDRDAALERVNVLDDYLVASDTRRRVAWGQYLYLMGMSLSTSPPQLPPGQASSSNNNKDDKGKGKGKDSEKGKGKGKGKRKRKGRGRAVSVSSGEEYDGNDKDGERESGAPGSSAMDLS